MIKRFQHQETAAPENQVYAVIRSVAPSGMPRMRLIAVRQHLRRLRRRLLQVDAMVDEPLLSDCDQAIAALGSALNEASDADLVCEQLLESAAVHVRRGVQMHPWGSSTDSETFIECELIKERIEIPIDTDSLPHSLSGELTQSCASLVLDFELLCVNRNARVPVAVYQARVTAIHAIPNAMLV